MAGSAVRKRQLGRELERLRKAAGLTQGQAANVLDCSTAKIAHFESGRNLPQRAELLLLVQTYGAEPGTYETLDEIRKEATKPGWWTTARLPEWVTGYVGLESDAASIDSVEQELIPGLLQTEAYIRELQGVGAGRMEPEQEERFISARLRRQERLSEKKPLKFSVVLSEAALVRCAHTSSGTQQLKQVYERAQWPNIDLRVMPLKYGLYAGTGQFLVMRFPHGLLPDAAYEENTVGHIIDDPVTVQWLERRCVAARTRALDRKASLAMLAGFAHQ